MFETAELGRALDKQAYAAAVPQLRTELLRLQRQVAAADFPVLVLIHGVDGAGRGDVLNLLHQWFDARYLTTYAHGAPTEEVQNRPPHWRFWMRMPPRGRIGVFFGSWYSSPILERAHGKLSETELDAAVSRINALEKTLVDDGALVIKLWFHISKQRQRKRFKRIESNPKAPWPVTKRDWRHHKLYDRFRRICGRVLRKTSTGEAPWTVIEASQARYRDVTAATHIIERVSRRLEAVRPNGTANPDAAPALAADATDPPRPVDPTTILDTLDLSQTLDKAEYETRLQHAQGRLHRLAQKMARQRRSTTLVFEGWDAAGKGGAVRRVVQAMDARDYRIIPISAPTDEEKAHHYLWRFWRHLPRLGGTTVYDRSWYGRVLVERVEGFASRSEWMRAYQEINDFEEQLVGFGVVLIKCWLHISNEEQLRRFREREEKPWKRHKITPEDYRNREKWADYELAANDMIGRTSTEYAPWTLVEGNDKRFARVKVLETVVDRLAAALE